MRNFSICSLPLVERVREGVAFIVAVVLFAGCQTAPVKKASQADIVSAVQSIGTSFTVQPGDVKYCPMDGTRYSGNLTKCPKCGAQLKPVQ